MGPPFFKNSITRSEGKCLRKEGMERWRLGPAQRKREIVGKNLRWTGEVQI